MKKVDRRPDDVPLLNGFSPEQPFASSLSPERQTHPLCQSAGMRIVWSQENSHPAQKDPASSHYIGSLTHSPQLCSALETGLLDPFLRELTRTYRDIYGGPPWNEYLICTRRECARAFSISEIHENEEYVPLDILEDDNPLTPHQISCHECAAPLEFFYPPEEFLNQLRESFRQKVIATFLFNEASRVLGFSLGWETTIRQGWKDKFLWGYGDEKQSVGLPYAEYLAEIREKIGDEVSENSAAFNSAEWAIAVPGRSSGASLPLYYANILAAFQAMSRVGEDIPVIGHTLLGSKALDIFRAVGFVHGKAAPESEQVRVYSSLKRLLQGICDFSTRKKK